MMSSSSWSWRLLFSNISWRIIEVFLSNPSNAGRRGMWTRSHISTWKQVNPQPGYPIAAGTGLLGSKELLLRWLFELQPQVHGGTDSEPIRKTILHCGHSSHGFSLSLLAWQNSAITKFHITKMHNTNHWKSKWVFCESWKKPYLTNHWHTFQIKLPSELAAPMSNLGLFWIKVAELSKLY